MPKSAKSLLRQKFPRLSFVRVSKKMPRCMSHFPSGFLAIVEGTYSQLYGGRDIKKYSLYMIQKGKVTDEIAWYEEGQLTLANRQDKAKAEQMIEDYNFADEEDKD